MKKYSVWAWTLTSILSLSAFSCAQAEGGSGDGDGDGDGDATPSGGAPSVGGGMSSGGVVLGMSGGAPSAGGAPAAGGMGTGGMMDTCMDGDMDDCSVRFPDFPVGTTTCSGGAWDISACLVCEPDSSVPCAEVAPTTPEGSLTCDSTGLGFVEDPSTVCSECEVDATTDCESSGNPTVNRKGTATCLGSAGYDWSECKMCLDGESIDCDEVPGNTTLLFGTAECDEAANSGVGAWDASTCDVCEAGTQMIACTAIEGGAHDYTGGMATCNGSGDGWVESTCTYCGDGEINDGEACDGSDLTPSTCGDEGFTGEGADTVVDGCTDECILDTSVCGYCPAGVAEADCMAGGSCTGSACTGKACGSTFTCDFNCHNNASNACSDTICSGGADCTFQCHSSGGCPGSTCKDGASCLYRCFNSNVDCTDITCEDGSNCNFRCENGGTCSTNGTMVCKAGDTCEVNCENSAVCAGMTVLCEAGSTCNITATNNDSRPTVTCEDGATCNVQCQNRNCSSTMTCTGAGCNCLSGTCF